MGKGIQALRKQLNLSRQ